MQLDTQRFGLIEVDPNTAITFTQPVLGFQEYRRFVLLPGPANSSLHWLQSTDSGALAFLLMDPCSVMPDYRVQLRPAELTELAVSCVEELDVYTLVVVSQDSAQVRTNLKAPILISPKHRLGKQTILERSDYPIQYFLARSDADEGASQEVASAGSDA